jgi:hypothetical protein
MIKSLAALAVFAFLGVTVLAFPGFAPEVKANASQIWPNIASTCLRQTGSDAAVREARLVTAHREP